MSFNFNIEESKRIKGVFIIIPSVAKDIRGTIWTSFLTDDINKLLPKELFFKHDKFSESSKNVLRGIHGDSKSWKLVTSVAGAIEQVVVDCRKNSSTYLQWEKFFINKDSQKLILIPPNMGNAYYVTSENAVYHYKLAYSGKYIDADNQFTLSWNDPKIAVAWSANNPILSSRDMIAKNLEDK